MKLGSYSETTHDPWIATLVQGPSSFEKERYAMRGADFDIMSSQRDRRSLDKIKHCGVDGVLFLPSSDKVSTNALRFEAYINTSS